MCPMINKCNFNNSSKNLIKDETEKVSKIKFIENKLNVKNLALDFDKRIQINKFLKKDDTNYGKLIFDIKKIKSNFKDPQDLVKIRLSDFQFLGI